MQTPPLAREYFAIPRDVIAADTATGADLYIHVGGRYLLYRSGREPVDGRSLAKLRRRSIQMLYIKSDARPALDAYLARMLERRLASAPTLEAAGTILRDTVRASLRLAFQSIDDGDAVQRVREASDATVRQIVDDTQIVPHLVRFAVGDERLYVHSLNTAAYAIALGAARDDVTAEELRSIGIGALAHDIGLATADVRLLSRDESVLSDSEHAYLLKHPERGVSVLQEAGVVDPLVLGIAARHHETGDDLPLHLQIVQLADSFDTLTNRPGRTDAGAYQALYTLRESIEGRYDPDLLRDFVLMLSTLELEENLTLTPLHPPLEAAKPAFRAPHVA